MMIRLIFEETRVDCPLSCELVHDFHIFGAQRFLILNMHRRFRRVELLEEVVEAICESHVIDLRLDLAELLAEVGHMLGTTIS